MHIPVPTFDRTVPMSINFYHAEAATRLWTQGRYDKYAAYVEVLLDAGVVLAKQPEDEVVAEDLEPEECELEMMSQPSPWFVESELTEAEADDEFHRLDGCREPGRDDDTDTQAPVGVDDEDEAQSVLRFVEEEA